MITEQERKRRRLMARFVQLALVMLAVGIGVAFVAARRGDGPDVGVESGNMTFSTDVPAAADLAPGDVQIFNVDSTVDLILRGDRIYAGLSPQTVAKVRAKLAESATGETNGIGALIASAVKDQVADKIDTHARYDVHDIRDIRIENERIVIQWKSGKEQRLFETIKSDGSGDANRFRREDAMRFIELVKARQKQPTP